MVPEITQGVSMVDTETTKRHYSHLVDQATFVLKVYNPCQIKGGFCRGNQVNKNQMCCDGCQYHTPKGCIAVEPLACKLWLCRAAQQACPDAAQELERLKRDAWNNSVPMLFRGSKADSFGKGE